MSKKDNVAVVPKYRFPEFLNCLDWKKEELNKLGKVISGLTYSPQDIREEGLLVLRSSNIKDNVIDLKDTVYVRSNIKGYTLTEEKDILICVRNGSKTLIGKNALVPKGMPLCTNGAFMIVFRANNPWFVFQLFQSKQFDKQVKADLGATINSINSKQLKKYIFAIPQERKEQQKIADCLSSIDDLIFSEEKKLSLLNDYKKGWMQKLFPSEGKTVPEWRFPEFRDSGDWENTTIEKIADYENGKAHENNIIDNGKYIVVNSKFISTEGEIIKYTNEANLLAYKGDILMVLSDVPNGRALSKCYLVEKDNVYTVNQRVCRIIPEKVNSTLLFYTINRNKYFLSFDDGVKQTNLKKNDVLSCSIVIPKEPDEQEKIADFLSGIDELISSQKEKIEKLKQHKIALMQGLFPSLEDEDV